MKKPTKPVRHPRPHGQQEPRSVGSLIRALFDAERSVIQLSHDIHTCPTESQLTEIEKALKEVESVESEQERNIRLVCLSRLLRGIAAPKALDLLIEILGSDEDEARAMAGMALEDLAVDQLGDVNRAISRALEKLPAGHQALRELPFVILGFEDDVKRLLEPFLRLPDPEAVGAAVESLVEYADPGAIAMLKPLANDARTVQIDDESTGDAQSITVGEFVADAIRALEEVQGAVVGSVGK